MKSVNIWNVFRSFHSKKSMSPLMSLYSQFHSVKAAADAINNCLSDVFSLSSFSHLIPMCPSSVELCVSAASVYDMLRCLPTHKSSPDIPCALFRAAAHILSEPLAYIFNLSLTTQCVPNALKDSVVTPVPKVSSPSIRDLRPISFFANPYENS